MLEVAKIILVHLLQDYELLKTGARVVAQRKKTDSEGTSTVIEKMA